MFNNEIIPSRSKSLKNKDFEKYVNNYIFDNIFDFSFIEDPILRNDYIKEFQVWVSFISKLINKVENISIYVKGGTPLGIDILKKYFDKCQNKNITLHDVLKMNLIKDWDFMTIIHSKQKFDICIKNYDLMRPYLKKNKVEEFIEKNPDITTSKEDLQPCIKLHEIMNIARTHNIKKEGSKMIIIRNTNCVKICDDVFFEMMIKTEDTFSEIELPLTTMKILLTKKNYKYMFYLSKLIFMASHYKIGMEQHLDIMKFILRKIDIIIYPHDKNGFLQTNETHYDTERLSSTMKTMLDETFSNYNDKQFIVSQIVHPDALFYRLLNKNIPKSNKIKNFVSECKIKHLTYLLNENHANQTVKKFLNKLSFIMQTINKSYKLDKLECVIKLYYDAQNDLLTGSINIVDNTDIDNFVKRFEQDADCKFGEKLKLYLEKFTGIVNLNKKVIDVVEYMFAESIKKMQDAIYNMILEYDNLFLGMNIGRLVAQFDQIIENESSKIMLSKISVKFSSNVMDRIKVTKNVKSNLFLYKLAALEYDDDKYNQLLK